MGRTLTYILSLLLLPLALLTGCASDDLSSDTLVDARGKTVGNSYITLTIYPSSRTSTRAEGGNPIGGELGDGTEKGQTYENTVTSAALFLYQATDVNADGATPVSLVVFNDMTQTTDDRPLDYIAVSEPQQTDLENGTYRVLAIANPQDLDWATGNTNLTLSDVRDHIEKVAWTETETDGSYSSFLMTSENDEKGSTIVLQGNPKEDPATTFVEVERTAARVDYRTDDKNSYTIGNTGDDIQGTITITGATLVNNLTAGSYLLKRTNNGPESTSVTYLGGETADGDGIATNYVIDPWTDEKKGGSYVTIDGQTADVSGLYGVYYPGYATEGKEQNPSFWKGLMTEGVKVTDEDTNDTWLRIGYTMENTTYAEYTSKQYSTAIVFGATFTPADDTVVDDFYAESGFSYTNGSTFFRWNNKLYATAEDMMAVAYPSTSTTPFTTDKFGETTFASITTIDALKAFAETLRDDDPTGYKAYLLGITEFPSDDKSPLYWEKYMSDSIHYEWIIYNAIGGEEHIMKIGSDTRALLYAATGGAVSTYENSQCYYTWWIRHSNNDNDETNGVMEYSIVRNNIYKVEVVGVQALGGDIPSEGLRIRVYVKDWTLLTPLVINL